MTWRVEFRPSARAELLALDRTVQTRVLRSLAGLAADPRAAAGVKTMKGGQGYRLRVGDWRVLYTLRDDILVLLVIQSLFDHNGFRVHEIPGTLSVFICVHLWFHFFCINAFRLQEEWNHR